VGLPRPITVEGAVDLYEARMRQFQHAFGCWQRDTDDSPEHAWSRRVATARRLLLLAEQYLADHHAHTDYEAGPGITVRVIASSGRCLRVVREEELPQ